MLNNSRIGINWNEFKCDTYFPKWGISMVIEIKISSAVISWAHILPSKIVIHWAWCFQEEIEDTMNAIRIRKSKKDR